MEIRALGEWSVRREGRPTLRGLNPTIVLHALVLGRGSVYREDLIALLAEHEQGASRRDNALRNALTKLRSSSLSIPPAQNPVTMSASQPTARIDLWTFFAHMEFSRYREAYDLIAEGQEPFLLPGVNDPQHPVWRATFKAFFEARDKAAREVGTHVRRQRASVATRERLLARSLVPGVGRQVAIGSVRDEIGSLPVPWHQERPRPAAGVSSLSSRLAEILSTDAHTPSQVILVGTPGAGKTLTAISTYLRLTDDPRPAGSRPVLYLDSEAEGGGAELGSDPWLRRRLGEIGEGGGRAIVVVPHGDTLLARREDLSAVLESSLFRDHDILLCCGTQFYVRRLSFEGLGTHVFHLDRWPLELQKQFARALRGDELMVRFSTWVGEDRARVQLCSVPLNLVHVLSLLDTDGEVLGQVSTPSQLLESVARMRLRVSRPPFDYDRVLEDLGAAAFRFYADAAPSDNPIQFTSEDLRQTLRRLGRERISTRTNAIIDETLLTVLPHSNVLRFEDPTWGRFFVARHVVHTVLHRPEGTGFALGKLLSGSMMALCEQMLAEKWDYYRAEILDSLHTVLFASTHQPGGRTTIAREQAAFLLGALGGEGVSADLASLLDPGSSRYESDRLVRRGVVAGLAKGEVAGIADAYLEVLRDERAEGGVSPERETNLGFLLSLSGDQELDPAQVDRIESGVDPSRTVSELVERLEEPSYAGMWRIMLFSLLDLARHPEVSPAGLAHALRVRGAELRKLLEQFRQDRRLQECPELAELEEIVAPPGDREGPRARHRVDPASGPEP